MEKLTGKVIRIPVHGHVTKGMQVVCKDKVFIVKDYETKETGLNRILKTYVMLGTKEVTTYGAYVEELCTLAIEFKRNGLVSQMPLKFSQWQAAIDNGEVETGKSITFETKFFNAESDKEDFDQMWRFNHDWIAKIIPVKKRNYTEIELREAMKYASQNSISTIAINSYIDCLNQRPA